MVAGEVVKCTFTNVKQGRIIVEKQTDPANDPTQFSFTASYDADGFSLADNGTNDSGGLAPGTVLGLRDGACRAGISSRPPATTSRR